MKKKSAIEEKTVIEKLRAQGVTLQSIGLKYGVTRERIRQITEGIVVQRFCGICGKLIPKGRFRYCSDKCSKVANNATIKSFNKLRRWLKQTNMPIVISLSSLVACME